INSMASYLFVIIVGSEQNLKQQYAIRMNRQDEVAAFQKLMPASAIESCSPEQLQASIQYTRYRKLRLRLRFPDNYPNEELVIELMSDTLPDVALRRLTKFVDAKASELAKLGQPQVQAVVEADPILTCRQQVAVRQRRSAAVETTGRAKRGRNQTQRARRSCKATPATPRLLLPRTYTHANIRLDDHYPDSPIAVSCDESNLPCTLKTL
ncbi:hypothetical protein AaE_000936, partial [Aphanomyces astaci]